MSESFSELTVVHDVGDDRFHADPSGKGLLFGGQTMVMALRAAAETVEDDLVPMSLRCSFLRFGEWVPTSIAVERVNASRSFASRRVRLTQEEALVAVADIAFHRIEHGPDRQDAPPPDIGRPEDLQPVTVVFGSLEPLESVDVRPATGKHPTNEERLHPFWGRVRESLDHDPIAQIAGLVFLSDYLVIRSPFEPGTNEGAGLRSFTLEHTIWFHRRVAGDQWMLFDAVPLTQSGGRYLSRGTIHDEQGLLLASFVQEGLIRPRR